jgi:Ca2+-binding RTX toxin-like protein
MKRGCRMSVVSRESSILFLTVVLLGGVMSSAPAGAQTRTFPGCGATVQACIDKADPGDTLRIATNNPIELTSQLLIPKSLTLKAAAGYKPVFKGKDQIRSFISEPASGSQHLVFDGLKLVDVAISFNSTGGSGHSVVVRNSTILLKNGNNGVTSVAIYFSDPSSGRATVVDNRIAGDGTGVTVSGATTRLNVSRNEITRDDAPSSTAGITFYERGGAEGTARIADNLIYEVSGSNAGAADALIVSISESSTLEADIVNNTIDRAGYGGGTGIGMLLTMPGGDISVFEARIYNNTLTRGEGAGIYVAPGIGAEGSNNNTRDNANGNSIPPSSSVGTIDVAPAFVDPAAGDYRLKNSSALLDAGTTCMDETLVSRSDLMGAFRVSGPRVDIGVYERGSSIPGDIPGENVTGSDVAESLTGSGGIDVLCGLDGADTIAGLGGSDLILGGTGKDVLQGGDGRDYVTGEEGADRAFGNAGSDVLRLIDGVKGNDRANGGPDSDDCFVDEGDIEESC